MLSRKQVTIGGVVLESKKDKSKKTKGTYDISVAQDGSENLIVETAGEDDLGNPLRTTVSATFRGIRVVTTSYTESEAIALVDVIRTAVNAHLPPLPEPEPEPLP